MSEDMMIDLVVAKAELGSMTNRYNSAMEMVERLYDIMLAHETVSDDDWNQGLHDCWLLLVGDTTNE